MPPTPADANLTKTPLWKAFEGKADAKQVSMVGDLVGTATQRLKAIRDTFPAYTLHDAEHSVNIVRLMGRLLGPRLKKITALEGAVLILSAYLHDIGMVFTDEERKNLVLGHVIGWGNVSQGRSWRLPA